MEVTRHRRLPAPLLLASMIGGLGTSSPLAAQADLERTVIAMGTELRLWVQAADRPAALRSSEAAIAAVAAADQRLSNWRDDSELQRLNHSPVGADLLLSPQLATELEIAMQWSRATAGAFDPGIGAVLDAYDLRGRGRWPAPARLAAARTASGLSWLELDGNHARRLHSGLRLDSGGFGKGAALDAAVSAALAAGAQTVVFDFGGQVATRGGAPHSVALADPAQRGRAVAELMLQRGSLAVSGNSERGRVVDGRSLPHLFDPRSGQPAPERGSFAVLAPTALAADCLSTALYIAGWDAAAELVAAHPDIGVAQLQPEADGSISMRTAGTLDGRLRVLDSRLHVVTAAGRGTRTDQHP